MSTVTVITYHPDETETLGRQIGSTLPARAVITLTGPLGSGKTTLIRGLVAARSTDPVSSPTFVYHQRYRANSKQQTASGTNNPSSILHPPSSGVIDHVDLYRVHTNPSLRARTGIDELLADVPGWLIIEWPLADLIYPIGLPVSHLIASGAPAWSFKLTTTAELDLSQLRVAR